MRALLRTRRDFIRTAAGTVVASSVPWTSELVGAMAAHAAGPRLISNIRESTISTDRLEESIHYYREHFGFEVVRRAELNDDTWRRLWRLPEGISATAVLLAAPGWDIGSIRLVQFSPPPKVFAHLPYRSLTTGYRGMDMEVPDMTSRFQGLVRHGHARVNAPIQYEPPNSKLMLTESVVVGPTGERLPMVIYRDIVRKDQPTPNAPEYTPVLAVFQVVEDLQPATEAYKRLGLQVTRERETSIPEVNRALGLPFDTRYKAIQLGNPDQRFARPILVQFLNKRVVDVSDVANPPNLGLIMTSYQVQDVDEACRRLQGSELSMMGGPVEINNALYGHTRVATFKQKSGAWIELYN